MEIRGGKRRARGRLHPNPIGMVDIIIGKALLLQLFGAQTFGELADDGSHHFQMRQFFGGYIVQKPGHAAVGHGITLRKIAHRGAELAIRPAELADDGFGKAGVFVFDLHREFQAFFINPHKQPSYSNGKGRSTQL